MPKDIPQPVNPPSGEAQRNAQKGTQQEPLSGSKRVKQENHSRHNNGEG